MSIIFGYINLTNKPVERTTLGTMKKAMDFWGPDGEGLWVEDTCGLGNLLYYNTPEALFEKLPTTDVSGNLVMTAGARIDNRDDLFRVFDIPLGRRLTMPDSALMLKAYEKWGEACADHLIGDWAFAVWDRRERKLFLARDHHGITALYYYKGEDFFVFSSSLKGILCLPQVPKKVNEYKIAQLLVNWNEGGPTTCYLDIMRLPPAHTLTLQNGRIATNRYWYLEHTPEVHLANDQEYADMFLDLYTEAVRCRLRSHRPVGATLSSGLDSGSVCILAAKELAKEGKRLKAYTAVPLYDVPAPPNRIGDEGPLAMALAEKLGNVDVTLCRAEGISLQEGIEKLFELINQPIFAGGSANWILEIVNNCKNDNIGTLLIGQNGNGTVSWPIPRILNTSYNKIILNHLRGYKQRLKLLLGCWEKDFLIRKEFAERINIKEAIINLNQRLYFNSSLTPLKVRMQLLEPGSSIIGDVWFGIGFPSKIEVRDPTIDLKLLKFLFGIPLNSEFSNNRKLFILNFKTFFSKDILEGRERGIQSIDLVLRYNYDNKKFDQESLKENNSNDLLSRYICHQKINDLKVGNSRLEINKLLNFYLINLFLVRN